MLIARLASRNLSMSVGVGAMGTLGFSRLSLSTGSIALGSPGTFSDRLSGLRMMIGLLGILLVFSPGSGGTKVGVAARAVSGGGSTVGLVGVASSQLATVLFTLHSLFFTFTCIYPLII